MLVRVFHSATVYANFGDLHLQRVDQALRARTTVRISTLARHKTIAGNAAEQLAITELACAGRTPGFGIAFRVTCRLRII